MNNLLNYNSWELKTTKLNESKISDKIHNWISRNLGGSISKIDKIIEKIKQKNEAYIEEWEEVLTEINLQEIERDNSINDTSRKRKAINLIARKKNFLSILERRHNLKVKSLTEKGKKYIKNNKRIEKYWEKKIADLDLELAEIMYNKHKELSGDDKGDILYSRYRNATEEAKIKDEEYLEVYGSYLRKDAPISSTFQSITRDEFKKANNNKKDFEYSNDILSLDLDSFNNEVSKLDQSTIKKILSNSLKDRNEAYVAKMREEEELTKELKNNPKKDNEIKQKLSQLKVDFNERIKNLRAKITILRRYVY